MHRAGLIAGSWLLCLAGLAMAAEEELKSRPITAEERSHWAFQPMKRPPLPALANREWARNPIDVFILARLEDQGLHPSPQADRSTLIRRLSFDLRGLPPTPEEIDDFLTDSSVEAYETVVDRFLSSPQYGVRWAQHWLDLARYADTDGFEFDNPRPDAWRYRDWVVENLNRDLPYDRFIALQLAGDELAPEDPNAFIATGFNRCYPDMVDLNDQGLRRQNALNDITETTGLVFLGLTIGCARCHDHKFDPIRQEDFYRLQAFFTPARFRDDYPVASAERRRAYEQEVANWENRANLVRVAIIRLEKPIRDRVAPGLPMGALDSAVAAFNKPEGERNPSEVRMVFELLERDRRITAEDWTRLATPQLIAQRENLRKQLDRILKSAPTPMPTARGVDEAGPSSPPTYFLRRGAYDSRGPAVTPAFPAVFEAGEPRVFPTEQSSGRRTALARWITRADHPLTARVIVNRIWQGHFVRGLVGTPSDFGTMGDLPSHPELLDWVATYFVSNGWSLKKLHRLIVTSATYQQSSRPSGESSSDPENRLLSRQNRRRLDGEAIRDALLSSSGQLNDSLGGPPVFPPLPPELSTNSSNNRLWPVSKRLGDHFRRGLYVFVRRNLRYPFFEVFDRPDTNASCPRRAVTTIAPQALSLLNSPLSHSAAQALASRVAREAGVSTNTQVARAYLLTLGRRPDGAESKLALEFLGSGGSLADLCLSLFNVSEFIYVD
jgi:hypothetical protein